MDGNRDDKRGEGLEKPVTLFCTVLLVDGREGDVVDIYTDPVLGYEIDFTRQDQPTPDIPTEGVTADKIAKVLWELGD